ncbi:MAG: XRE family transcriptional regulator [Alphaproteobacteria bacterium]|jgi:transcriptional regulator with XRE-family HTH domain|nr:helix-turn-helix transcriptional regulator [Rhodospirillaceae bacterium]MBT6205405.1 helix-turn-helix transcriptional regulator [Rhodospirillaceae bacterium]MBT6511061.1 helix-turn-helix transcriptional regulator [Rhodospirillaceae bacterium]MDG2482537.1 XRE family transcriptional regulator [Alphaproteobacteria bacterium]
MPPDPLFLTRRASHTEQAPQPPLDLGRRIRELRTERGWSFDQAAAQTGLSRSSLFKIEKGRMSPTFDALKKLADGFGLAIPQLLISHGDSRAASRRSITRGNDKQHYKAPNYDYRPLAEDLAHKAMLPFELILRARSLDDFEDWDRHDTEDFVHVLKGTMVLFTEFYEPVTLEAGDSIYYDGHMGHAAVSVSDRDAVVLWVSST